MTPAVFLDRDGVINENRRDHVKSWTEFQFLPGAIEAIARLTRAGLRVFVVTNQAVISRGLDRAVLERMHLQMVERFGIDPRRAVMASDALTDIDAGRATGR